MSGLIVYPPVDVERLPAPPRSVLYPRAPRGAGTVLAEGLPSLVMGLAEAHDLPTGVLVGRVLGPAIMADRRATVEAAELLRQGGPAIGMGIEARSWVAVFSTMTGVDVTCQTMLPWAPVLPATHVVGTGMRHCPACLADVGPDRPFEPLIWGLELVTACPVHGARLEDRCPACGRKQRPLTYRSLTGLCRSCGAWLGASRPARAATAWERWTSGAIAELVAHPVDDASRDTLVEALRAAVDAYGIGAAGLAGAAGIARSGLSSWLRGSARPSIEAVLRVCATGGWSVREFLLGRLVALDAPLAANEIPPSPWARSQSRDWRLLRRRFRRLLDAPGEPPTFAAIARELRIDRKALRLHEPELARSAVARRKAWVATRTAERRDRAIASVIAITRELHADGITPSRRQVEARLETPFTLQEAPLREAWQQTVRALSRAA